MRILLACLFLSLGHQARADLAEEFARGGIETRISAWHGFSQLRFAMPETSVSCIVVAPKEAAEGKPWIWRARFFGHQPALDIELLKRGWHVCYCDVSGLFGSPQAVQRWNRFHTLATDLGLSSQPVLEGMSRGGLIIFNWASANPGKVRAIYGDNPVCDFRSWPGGVGAGKGSGRDWKRCLSVYGIDETAAKSARQPRDAETLKPIAAAKIPVFLVLGEADKVVPVAENADLLAAQFKKLGGTVTEWRKPGQGHHPHGLHPVGPLLEAILETAASD